MSTQDHEYCIQDYTFTYHNADGQTFRFDNNLEDATYGAKGESKTIDGSGTYPRAHVRTKKKPTAELTIPVDLAARFERFVGDDGVGRLVITRQKPHDVAITDVMIGWKPTFDTVALKSGDAATTKVTGNGLGFKKDVKNALAA
jgi:hypothetical protein